MPKIQINLRTGETVTLDLDEIRKLSASFDVTAEYQYDTIGMIDYPRVVRERKASRIELRIEFIGEVVYIPDPDETWRAKELTHEI